MTATACQCFKVAFLPAAGLISLNVSKILVQFGCGDESPCKSILVWLKDADEESHMLFNSIVNHFDLFEESLIYVSNNWDAAWEDEDWNITPDHLELFRISTSISVSPKSRENFIQNEVGNKDRL